METNVVSGTGQYKHLANGMHSLLRTQTIAEIGQIACYVCQKITDSVLTRFIHVEGKTGNCLAEEVDSLFAYPQKIEICYEAVQRSVNSKQIIFEELSPGNKNASETRIESIVVLPLVCKDVSYAVEMCFTNKYAPSKSELDCLQKWTDMVLWYINSRQEQLLAKQKELDLRGVVEAYEKEQELFSYAMTHDLKAPLRAIREYVTIFMEENSENLKANGKQLSTKIISNVNQMSLMINEMMTVFKAGKAEINKTTLPMNYIVEKICEQVKERATGRDVIFQIDNLPNAEGDMVLIKKVWLNLIENALKYSSKKEQTVVHIGYTRRNGQTSYFVKDNGVGFDMKYASRLFGAFQRLHSRNDFEGVGVGLNLVKKIINRHGGLIWAEAEVNKGATFYFTL